MSLSYMAFQEQFGFRYRGGACTPDARESYVLVEEYCRFDAADPSFDSPESWNSHAALAANRKVIFVFWEPPPSGFVKVNFDGSVRDDRGGADFVIWEPEIRLLMAKGSYLFEPSVPGAKLQTA